MHAYLDPDVDDLDDQAAVDAGPPPLPRSVGVLARWHDTEPVRLYLYPVAAALIGLLVATSVINEAVAPPLMALVAALLGVGTAVGVETARANVYSERSSRLRAHRAARAAAAAGRDAWAGTVSTETSTYRLGPL